MIDFAADGTGVSFENLSLTGDVTDPESVAETFTWSVSGNVLKVVYDDFEAVVRDFADYPFQEFIDEYGFEQEAVDFLIAAYEDGLFPGASSRVDITRRTVSTTNTLGLQQSDQALVSTTQRIEYSMDAEFARLNWPGELPRGVVLNNSEFLVLLPDAISNGLQNPPAVGDTWAVPHLYVPNDPSVWYELPPQGWLVDVFTLAQAGTTSDGLLSKLSFTWAATADGFVFERGGERYTYTPIKSTDGSIYIALVTYSVDGDVVLRSAQWIAHSDGTGGALAADLGRPLPYFWQSGHRDWMSLAYETDGQLSPLSVAGYSFNGNGTAVRIISPGIYNYDGDCVTDDSVACFSTGFGSSYHGWSGTGNTLFVDDYSNVFLTVSHTWTVLSYQPGGRAVILEHATSSYYYSTFYILPHIITMEVLDLSDWPEEWADAEGLYEFYDGDGDGIADPADSCLMFASTDLRDTDGDGIGNVCDSDLNQDCQVNFQDLGLLKSVFFTTPNDANWNPDADFDGDASVNFSDLGVLKNQFFMAPGPSGVPNLCESL
ncbi:MAG: hypothetical protein AAFN78_07195 [Pseudomonadota bacterium]